LFERALGIDEKVLGPEHPHTATDLNNLAILLYDLGECTQALGLVRRSVAALTGHFRRSAWALTKSERLRNVQVNQRSLHTLLALAPVEGPGHREILEALLIWKGQVGREMLHRRWRWEDLTHEQRSILKQLRGVQARLQKLAYAPAMENREEHIATIKLLREERNALELNLNRSLGRGDEDLTPSLAALQAALPEDSALLEFFVHPLYAPVVWKEGEVVEQGYRTKPHLSAWVVRSGMEEVVRHDLGPAEQIEGATQAFLNDLVARRGGAALPEEGEDPAVTLHELLWDTVRTSLKGVDTVFVSPDSFLGGLPLEVLQEEDGCFLIEQHAFVYIQDVEALIAAGESRDDFTRPGLLAVGAVNYDHMEEDEPSGASQPSLLAQAELRGSWAEYWDPLSWTRYEVESLDHRFKRFVGEGVPHRMLDGGAVTEARLKEEMPRYGTLHLATHGFFNPAGLPSMWEDAQMKGANPVRLGEDQQLVGLLPGLLSGLVCAGANEPSPAGGEDGFLTAEEVTWLDLRGCDLVVLSACETGLGRPQSGEGMMSLRRAFHLAGARTVVSSLWQVKDESTTELMLEFYRNLWQGHMGKLEALRTAQLKMLERNRRAYRGNARPSTWGAFVLSGDWR
jgi:CHAT domain-containing protein